MQVRKISRWAAALIAISGINLVYADVTVPMYLVAKQGQGKSIGYVTLQDSFGGVLITPQLHDLPAGVHGFHIHVNPDCGDNGMAAGGHLDPEKTNQHDGPYVKKGHLGDLPILVVTKDGTATLPTLAPRFTLAIVNGHSLMIHAGGDNYADQPEKLGGGGPRIACGVIPAK